MREKHLWILTGACAGLFLLLHAWLGRYAHPMADDFSYALKDVSAGAWAATAWEYEYWNGRYASNFLVLYGPFRQGFDGITLYRWIPALLMGLTLCGAFAGLRAMAPALPRTSALIGALIWTALFMHLMPDMAEGFYWYTGAVTYQLPHALTLFAVACLAWWHKTGRLFYAAVASGLLFICVGFNEVIMVLTVVATAAGVLAQLRAPRRWNAGHAMIISAVLIGTAIMLLAPGNEARGRHFGGTGQLFHSAGMSVLQTLRFGTSWTLSGPLLLLSVLCWCGHEHLCALVPSARQGFHVHPAISTTALFAVIFLCCFPPYWSTGILGQHRTVNTACFFFLPLWFINLTAWRVRFGGGRSVPFRASAVLIALFLSALVFTGNSGAAMRDQLSGRAARSDAQLWERYARLRNVAPGSVARVPLIEGPPRTLYILDLREPDFLANVDYAAWFGLESVEVDDAGERVKGKHITP